MVTVPCSPRRNVQPSWVKLGARLMPAAQTGPSTYQGLLPDCATSPSQPLQVNCNKTPGVLQRQTTFAADGKTPLAHTLLVAIPPGFDMRISN